MLSERMVAGPRASCGGRRPGAGARRRRTARGRARRIDAALPRRGFFYRRQYGVDRGLQDTLVAESRRALFARPDGVIAHRDVAVWRLGGWFRSAGELDVGARPDRARGAVLLALSRAGPSAGARGTPLHGPNLFPDDMPVPRRGVALDGRDDVVLGHRRCCAVFWRWRSVCPKAIAARFGTTPLTLSGIFD